MDGKYSVLLVEDNYIAMMTEKAMLEHLNCEVVCAQDGKEAIDAATVGQYELILMDIGLPNIDGIEASQKIRDLGIKTANGSSVPIVAVTGNNDPLQRDKCFKVGMNDVIGKPLTLEIAQEILTNHIHK